MPTGPPLAPRIRQALDAYKRSLRARFGPALLDLRVFGSHARGQGRAGSDIDVLVVLEGATWNDRATAIDLATDIGFARDLLISPTVFDRVRWDLWREQERPLAREIVQDGFAL